MIVNSFHNDLGNKDPSIVCNAIDNLIMAFNYDTSVTHGLKDTILSKIQDKFRYVKIKSFILYNKMNEKENFDNGYDKIIKDFFIDSDPSVMQTSISMLYRKSFSMSKGEFKTRYIKYFDHLINVMKQNLDHKLTSDYDYHKVPSPWFQIQSLRILSLIIDDQAHKNNESMKNLFEIIQYGLERNNDPYHNGG